METVLAATSTVSTLVGEVFTLITGNALLCVFVAAGLIRVGIGVFRSVKGASRG